MDPQTRLNHSHHLGPLLQLAWLSLCLLPGAGHAQQLDWSEQFGTANDDRGNAVAVYEDGVYIVGQLDAETPGGDGRDAVGEGYVHRYDTAGNVVWQRRFGASPLDTAYAVAVDASGVYVTGATAAAPANRLNPDVLLTRYDHNGNRIWSRQFGDASGDTGFGVALDATGVYVAGGANWLHRGFVAKYTRDGADRWIRYFGDVTTDTEDWATGVAADASGVYVSGILNSYSGSQDAVLLRYDSDGNQRWERIYSTPGTERGQAVAVNADGIYLLRRLLARCAGKASFAAAATAARANCSGRSRSTAASMQSPPTGRRVCRR